MKRLRRRGFLHHIVQEGVMDHFCKKFKKKAFGIRKILFRVEEQQAVGALTMAAVMLTQREPSPVT